MARVAGGDDGGGGADGDRPFPPGEYPILVVGSGPGGLQTSYCLRRLGVEHAVISRDDRPGGMFRWYPVFQRLLSWTQLDAPFERGSREFEWYDHNSLLGDEREHQALICDVLDRSHVVPTRQQMEDGLAAFAERTPLRVRYGCSWESTRRENGRLVLTTSDGEYRCRAAVFALGVTEPWRSPIPGIDQVPHYADCRHGEDYAGKSVFIIGKRNSAFELADGLLPWASRIVLASPRPVETSNFAQASVRARYLQPYEVSVLGGGTYAVDAAIERIERDADGFRISASGTTRPGRIEMRADAAIAATGFTTPLRDQPQLGVAAVAQGRIPALTPFWRSVSAEDIYFAGNATQGAAGLRKHGVGSSSPAVHGFRYNARVLAEHLARDLFGIERERRRFEPAQLVPFLLHELAHAPELWAQKGYLARAVRFEPAQGIVDAGVVPLAHFVDAGGPEAIAVAVEMDTRGQIYPAAYRWRGGRLRGVELAGELLHRFQDAEHARVLTELLDDVVR
ncbi:MAG: NAD(P)-binding domain-containing protein [Thermoleophilia bacterium]|nr:NAD(P)-binding domain-containing protein [Thermoleophilia bacterium]